MLPPTRTRWRRSGRPIDPHTGQLNLAAAPLPVQPTDPITQQHRAAVAAARDAVHTATGRLIAADEAVARAIGSGHAGRLEAARAEQATAQADLDWARET